MSFTTLALVEDRDPIIVLSRGLVVRPLCHDDAEPSARMANSRNISRNMNTHWPEPHTVDKAHDFIAKQRDQDNWYPIGPAPPKSEKDNRKKLPVGYAIVQNDKFIGSIGVKIQKDFSSRCHSIGYWIGEEYWGQGIATEVVRAFVAWMFDSYPDMVRVEAFVYSWNPGSARVLEKAGFELEGRAKAKVWRYDQLCDLLMFGLVREGIST